MGGAVAGIILYPDIRDGDNCCKSANKDVEGNVRSQDPSFNKRGGMRGGAIRPEWDLMMSLVCLKC